MSAELELQREVTRMRAGWDRAGRVRPRRVGRDPRARHHRPAQRGCGPVHDEPQSRHLAAAVDRVVADLGAYGYEVEVARQVDRFARLNVVDARGMQVDVDLGVDWRQSSPAVLEVGPVLSIADAVGSKVAALYSRGEPRGFLDRLPCNG